MSERLVYAGMLLSLGVLVYLIADQRQRLLRQRRKQERIRRSLRSRYE